LVLAGCNFQPAKGVSASLKQTGETSLTLPDSLLAPVFMMNKYQNRWYVLLRFDNRIIVLDTLSTILAVHKPKLSVPDDIVTCFRVLSDDSILLSVREETNPFGNGTYIYNLKSDKLRALNIEKYVISGKENEKIDAHVIKPFSYWERFAYLNVYWGHFHPPGLKMDPPVSSVLKYDLHADTGIRLPIYHPAHIFTDSIAGDYGIASKLITAKGIYLTHNASDSIYFYPHNNEKQMIVNTLTCKELPSVIKATPHIIKKPNSKFELGRYLDLYYDSSSQTFLRFVHLPSSGYDENSGKFLKPLQKRVSVILADANLNKIGETELPAGAWDVYNSTFSDGKLYIPQRKSYTDTIKTIKISIFEMVRE
jgi:hypothetical protein